MLRITPIAPLPSAPFLTFITRVISLSIADYLIYAINGRLPWFREAREKKEKQERERRELAVQSVQAQEVAAQCRKTAEVSRLDEQGKDHPFSQQIIAQREDIDNALDPEHAAHLWLNHATVLLHEAEHQVTHWRHRIKVNQESKLALCLLPEIDVERMTRAIDDLTNSEIIHHDRLLQRDRARFIYDAAQKKRAQVRQDLQIGGNDEGRKAL